MQFFLFVGLFADIEIELSDNQGIFVQHCSLPGPQGYQRV